MHSDVDINLAGEILPVSLLKCKNALDALKPRELLSIRTDDRIVAENMTKFIHVRQFKIVHQEKTGDAYTFFIAKE
jgi:TusA-related sulfurtransferase